MSAEVKAFTAEQAAAKEILSLTLDDIHENACTIDEQCRRMVKLVLEATEDNDDGYAAELLAPIAEIWLAAHCIRRNVARDDEPKDDSSEPSEIQGMVHTLARRPS